MGRGGGANISQNFEHLRLEPPPETYAHELATGTKAEKTRVSRMNTDTVLEAGLVQSACSEHPCGGLVLVPLVLRHVQQPLLHFPRLLHARCLHAGAMR